MREKTKRWAVGATAAVAFVASWAILGSHNSWLCLLFSAAAAAFYLALFRFMDHKDACFTRRMQANDVILWDVLVNGIKVGMITDAEYSAIQRDAFFDWRNAVGQSLNITKVALVILSKVVVGVPLVAFWVLATLAVFAPESLAETLQAFQAADAAQLPSIARALLHMGFVVVVLPIGVSLLFGANVGFINVYSAAVGKMLQGHFGIPADGDTYVRESIFYKVS